MKNERTIVENRRNKIYDCLLKFEVVRVDKLAELLNVSALTIRRDLDYFEEKKIIERFYGGAALIKDNARLPAAFNISLSKHAIAKKAAELVENEDTIFINTSSTALLMLKYIKNKRVTVITNNGKAMFSECDPLVSVVLTGGELRFPKESMVGEFALNNLNLVTANKSFLGVNGISAQGGVTTAIMQEAPVNEAMLDRVTGLKIILADSSKVGKDSNFHSASIDNITTLITDTRANKEQLEKIAMAEVDIITVEPLKSI